MLKEELHDQSETISAASEDQTVKADRNELVGKDPFSEYFKITSFLFQEYERSPLLLEKAIKLDRGFVPALIYIPGESRPTVDITREHALYENGVWRTIDTVTVQSDKKSEFIIKGMGKWTENPEVSPDPERKKGKLEYQNLNSLIKAFNKATHIKGSVIRIFHAEKFVSDGQKWVKVPPAPSIDLR